MCSSLLVDAASAAKLLDISLSHFFGLRKAGKFAPVPVKLGRSTRFSCPEIQAWIAAGTPSRDRWMAVRDQFLKSR
jgi:predicted DNA-binding transcriptional regulator AlpA